MCVRASRRFCVRSRERFGVLLLVRVRKQCGPRPDAVRARCGPGRAESERTGACEYCVRVVGVVGVVVGVWVRACWRVFMRGSLSSIMPSLSLSSFSTRS